MRSLFFAFLALFAAASFDAAAQPTPPSPEIRAEPEVQPPVPDARGRPLPPQARAANAAAVALTRPTPEEIAQRMAPPAPGTPLQVAFGRDLPATATEAQLHGLLQWEPLDTGGQVAAVRFTSPGASALRLGLRVIAMPEQAVLRFRNADEMFEATGDEILETIARNLEAGDHGPDARTFWSPVLESESLVLEIELPPGVRPQDLHVAIPQLAHFTTSAREDFVQKASSTCELDATCYQSTWGTESNAVARMYFQVGTSGYLCSGTLVVDRDTSTTVPYFLSANHCIGSQTTASTLQTYWFYRSSTCNGGSATYQTITGGATLLYATGTTDTSFMRLNTAPPAGVTFAGWSVGTTPGLNAGMTGLHHPRGDPQKISMGSLWSYAICQPSGADTFSCNTASSGTGTFLGILWSSGLTEPGSSGSGLFLNNGHYLVGQLYGGSSLCGSSQGPDFYGRFDTAYNAALSQWLSPASYTLGVSKTGTGTGTVSSSPSGINCGSTCSAGFTQGSTVSLSATPSGTSAFTGWSGACSGSGTCTVTINANTNVTASFNDPALVPGAPTNVAATPSSGQATLTFTPPTNTGGSAIARYTATCNPNGFTGTASASPVVVTGLADGTTYTCSVTATNATATGPASASVTVTPPGPPALLGVVSRKTHAITGYDLAIDLTKAVNDAGITVEPRIEATDRVYFRFNVPVSSAGLLSVTDSAGASVAATAQISGSEVVVSSSAFRGRRVRIALAGVNGVLNVAAAVGFLPGDVSGNGRVTSSDLLRMKGKMAGSLWNAFLDDLNLDGYVNQTDYSLAQARAGTALP